MKLTPHTIVHLSIGWICFFIMPFCVQAQKEQHLLEPGYFDTLVTQQLIGDSVLRVYNLYRYAGPESSGLASYTDMEVHQVIEDPESYLLGGADCFYNSVVTTLPFVLNTDGSGIFGFNLFDCDYWPPGGIIKQDANQERLWTIDFRELNIDGMIGRLIYVDSNIIAAPLGYWNEYSDTLYFNNEGEFVDFHPSILFFDQTIPTPFGFFGITHDRLYILDAGFNIQKSYSIEPVLEIQDIGNQNFVVVTENKLYEYSEGQLQSMPNILAGCNPVWISSEFYWGYQPQTHSILQVDTFFNPVDDHPLAVTTIPIRGLAVDTQMIVTALYSNDFNRAVYTMKSSEQHPDFSLVDDIGITQVEIPDSVEAFYLDEIFAQGWFEYFKDAYVEVTNFGSDTIDEFYIECKKPSGCYWCYSGSPTWEIDSVQLAPGESRIISLGKIHLECSWAPGTICFTTYAPNERGDYDYTNDDACGTYTFFVDTKEVLPEIPISLAPVPADDELLLSLDAVVFDNAKCTIWGMTGQNMDNFLFDRPSISINTSNWPAGMYLLKAWSDQSQMSVRKFVVAH
ncbi:MAG TPA: hypothetical protein VFV79_10790 [Saprospiraceae bacterium]|nr:hypothetical protein [Saprospiraceae bacterium]